ncbi:MAG: sigma-54 dependent transcriptional regulator [Gammaproteobacteria bacterium]
MSTHTDLRPEAPAQVSGLPGLLLVDDDPLIVETLALALKNQFQVITASGRKRAKTLLQSLPEIPSLALVDLGLPPQPHAPDEGFALINELLASNQHIKILVLSGQSDRGNIQHALTLGAVDFIPKPCDINLLRARLQHQLLILDAEQQAEVDGTASETAILGDSEPMRQLQDQIGQFARSPFPVLVEGESGSGKELVARQLHVESERADLPFMTINCAAFTPELLEAQLFGHARGAYTGANQARAGFFEAAAEGSLFLDEIGELPLDLQSKLLRVLENGEYYRLGETQPRQAKARIIAATNRDLRSAVRAGEFRQDLFHRMSVLSIRVPALRERGNDRFILLEHFRKLYVLDAAPFRLDTGAEACLQKYDFPGNVRELRNIVIRLLAKYPGQTITQATLLDELEVDHDDRTQPGVSSGDDSLERDLFTDNFNLDTRLLEWERRYINLALKMSDGNLSKAARLLGINRTTLYSRLERLSRENG